MARYNYMYSLYGGLRQKTMVVNWHRWERDSLMYCTLGYSGHSCQRGIALHTHRVEKVQRGQLDHALSVSYHANLDKSCLGED